MQVILSRRLARTDTSTLQYPELRGVHYSEVQVVLVIGRSACAKARRPLDGDVRYLVCLL
jgi:hypothetical protein